MNPSQPHPALNIAAYALLAGLLVYPFSIAASNLFFAIMLLIVLPNRALIQQGWRTCWSDYQPITIGILCFILFTFVGTLWSEYTELSLHKMGKQLNWLIIPVIIALVYVQPKLRLHAFIFISTGLFLHLILCTLQYNGVVNISGQGSNLHDATGLVGHLSFGFIYGIWAGALLVAAQTLPKKWKYVCYILCIYDVVTVFMAQGRSGYITTLACLALVALKVLFPGKWKLKVLFLAVVISAIAIFISTHPPTQHKIDQTISGVSAFFDGNWDNTDLRIKLWATSIEVWKENPWFGVGTADYQPASYKLLQQEEFAYLAKGQPLSSQEAAFGHPHNEFLFELARWGVFGLLALLYLCWHWIGAGWKKDWQHDTMNAYLLTASGISVVLHGLTEPSLNKQLETVFAFIVLAFAMSRSSNKQ
ncbi:MAG: O-antigen ligase family protein [Mariprofundaceae bacterium]|nr:O-antigen ligase family protein [Mariprofundaceae bacterium]